MVRSLADTACRSFWGEWERVTCPTLVVLARSGIIPALEIDVMLRLRPATTAVSVPRTGHDLHLERPDALYGALSEFLDAHAGHRERDTGNDRCAGMASSSDPSDRDRKASRLALMPGVRSVRRPVAGTGEFDLRYVRTGPRSDRPILVIPGGRVSRPCCPTGASGPRPQRGVDVLMVEHRGIGLSRRTMDGADLPPEAITIEHVVADLAAVLDAEGVGAAVVYGTSYGTYLAGGFGVRHSARVARMILDSPMVGVDDRKAVRDHARSLLWDGTHPATARGSAALRALVSEGVVPAEQTGRVAQVVYKFSGPHQLERLYHLLCTVTARRGLLRMQSPGGPSPISHSSPAGWSPCSAW